MERFKKKDKLIKDLHKADQMILEKRGVSLTERIQKARQKKQLLDKEREKKIQIRIQKKIHHFNEFQKAKSHSVSSNAGENSQLNKPSL